jgi:hypothetical protein
MKSGAFTASPNHFIRDQKKAPGFHVISKRSSSGSNDYARRVKAFGYRRRLSSAGDPSFPHRRTTQQKGPRLFRAGGALGCARSKNPTNYASQRAWRVSGRVSKNEARKLLALPPSSVAKSSCNYTAVLGLRTGGEPWLASGFDRLQSCKSDRR